MNLYFYLKKFSSDLYNMAFIVVISLAITTKVWLTFINALGNAFEIK